jgi:hypothetical protein
VPLPQQLLQHRCNKIGHKAAPSALVMNLSVFGSDYSSPNGPGGRRAGRAVPSVAIFMTEIDEFGVCCYQLASTSGCD